MLMMKKKMMMILKICVDHIYVTLDFDPERWWFVLEKYEIDDHDDDDDDDEESFVRSLSSL